MADFETGDVVRLGSAFLMLTTDQIVNVFHVKLTAGGPKTFAAASTDFAAYIHYIYNPMMASYPTGFASDRISVKNETQDTVWGSIAFQTPLAGSGGGAYCPLQVGLLSYARTPISRVQIRKYWGPFLETAVTAGLWASGIRATCQTAMDYHITSNVMPGGLTLQGVAYNKTLARATTAYSSTTAEVPVVQRRRRKGRGA